MYNQKMSIGCLEFKQIGKDIWVAKDPIHDDKRWLIKKDKLNKLELVAIQNGIVVPIAKDSSLFYLAWMAFSKFIEYLAEYKFRDVLVNNIEEYKKINKLISSMSKKTEDLELAAQTDGSCGQYHG